MQLRNMRYTFVAWLAVAGTLAATPRLSADVIDRILAVVGGELVTLSDAAAAIRLGLAKPAPAGADPIRSALDSLIERQLELAEANRYQPPEPSADQIAARLADVRTRVPSQAAFDGILTETGLSEEQLRARLRDDLRIESYLSQRFGSARQPSEQDSQAYYAAHAASFATAAGLQPFESARERVLADVVASQRAAAVSAWLDGLRKRTDVTDLYVAPPSSR